MKKFDFKKEGTQKREFKVDPSSVDFDERTVEIAFSSEAEVPRWWGVEVLSHDPAAVDLGRFNDGAAFLVNHNTADQVGVLLSAKIDSDRVGRGVVRFGRGARATEILQDIQDGIRPHISIRYEIHDAKLVAEADGVETWMITRWAPLEASTVPIPADPTVGVGRSTDEPSPHPNTEKRGKTLDPDEIETPVIDNTEAIRTATVEATKQGAKETQARNAEIAALGKRHGATDYALAAIAEGKTPEEFRNFLLERKPEKVDSSVGELGLDERDLKKYSVLRLLRAGMTRSNADRKAAGFEIEVGEQAAKLRGVEPEGQYIPFEALQGTKRRDMTVGVAAAGGNLVSTDLLATSFIDLLMDASVVAPNCTLLQGLVGDIALPRATSGATAYWVAEGGSITEGTPGIDQVALSPNTLGCATDLSKKLLAQSSIDVEALVRRMMAEAIGVEIDRATINGSGSGAEPEGLLQKSIGSVALGTNGAAPTWAMAVELETDVAAGSALMGRLAYLTNAVGRGALKTNFKNPTYGETALLGDDGTMNNYPVLGTNQVPSNLTKGSGTGLSALLFGDWASWLIGFWGGIDVVVNPYSNAKSRTVEVVMATEVDMNARHEESFSACVDMVTS